MADKKVVGWFTMNGKHIPMFEGESKADAVKRSVQKSAVKKSIKDGRNHQPVSKGYVDKKEKEFFDASKKAEIMDSDIEAPKFRKEEVKKAIELDKAVEKKEKNGEIKKVKISDKVKKQLRAEKTINQMDKDIKKNPKLEDRALTKHENERAKKEKLITNDSEEGWNKILNSKNGDKIKVEQFSALNGKPTGEYKEFMLHDGRWSSADGEAFENNTTSKGFGSFEGKTPKIIKSDKADEKEKSTAEKNEDIKAKQIADAKKQANKLNNKETKSVTKSLQDRFNAITPAGDDGRKAMDNAEDVGSIVDDAPVGTQFFTSDKYGIYGYEKSGENKFKRIVAGLYSEGAMDLTKTFNEDDVCVYMLKAIEDKSNFRVEKKKK